MCITFELSNILEGVMVVRASLRPNWVEKGSLFSIVDTDLP